MLETFGSLDAVLRRGMIGKVFFPLDTSELCMFVRYPAWALIWRARFSLFSDFFSCVYGLI